MAIFGRGHSTATRQAITDLRAQSQLMSLLQIKSPPKSGTKLRALYDALTSQPNTPVHVPRGVKTDALEDKYGFNLKRLRRPNQIKFSGEIVLLGRWIGDEYFDYVEGHVSNRFGEKLRSI